MYNSSICLKLFWEDTQESTNGFFYEMKLWVGHGNVFPFHFMLIWESFNLPGIYITFEIN